MAITIPVVEGGGLSPAADPYVGRFLRRLQLGALSGSQKRSDRSTRDEREFDRIRNDPTKILCERGW